VENLEWFGYSKVKKIEDTITRFDRIHERDGRTDGRTPHDGIGRDCALHSIAQQKPNRPKESRTMPAPGL